jgi:hypothetical protein
MPIKLTWTEPESSVPIVGYSLYKRVGMGPLTPSHFLTVTPASIRAYDDYNYDRSILESVGYSYVITTLAASEGGQSNSVLITHEFVQVLYAEPWEFYLNKTPILAYTEPWDFLGLPDTPVELYFEDWEFMGFPDVPMELYTEGWES